MKEITTTKKIILCGTSLTVNVTKEAQAIGASRGDYVEVTIKNKEDNETWELLDSFDHNGDLITVKKNNKGEVYAFVNDLKECRLIEGVDYERQFIEYVNQAY